MYGSIARRHAQALLVALALMLASLHAHAVLRPPSIDDRSYQDLVSELVERIPVHAPEWTDVNASDPGFSLLELFAFLDDLALDAIIVDFHDRPWWIDLEIGSEEFLSELAYSLLEAGLTLALPEGEKVPLDWPERYGVDLESSYAELVAAARIPEPGSVWLLGVVLPGLATAAGRQRGRRGRAGSA